MVKQFVISIHAPAKGATHAAGRHSHTIPISIHAPAKGATYIEAPNPTDNYNFNPRSREGSDG